VVNEIETWASADSHRTPGEFDSLNDKRRERLPGFDNDVQYCVEDVHRDQEGYSEGNWEQPINHVAGLSRFHDLYSDLATERRRRRVLLCAQTIHQ
jgi:hypothetical protein